MNNATEQAARTQQNEQESFVSPEEFRLHALKHLKIRTIVKEIHGTPIHTLEPNLISPPLHNLFATVSQHQATVYDDFHLGQGLAVNIQYESPLQVLTTCAWIPTHPASAHPFETACLAVGSEDGTISIISLSEAAVISQISSQGEAVAAVQGCTGIPSLLCSQGRDTGTIWLWDHEHLQLVGTIEAAAALTFSIHSSGNCLLTADAQGQILEWPLCWETHSTQSTSPVESGSRSSGSHGNQSSQIRHTGLATKQKVTSGSVGVPQLHLSDQPACQQPQLAGSEGIRGSCTCIRFIAGDRLAARSEGGQLMVWDWGTKELLSKWKVPGCPFPDRRRAADHTQLFPGFSSTPDGMIICAGNAKGDVYIYETDTGVTVNSVSPIHVSGWVLGCGVSSNGCHVLSTLGNGYIFRHEYRSNADEEAGEKDDGAGDDMPADSSSSDGEGEGEAQQAVCVAEKTNVAKLKGIQEGIEEATTKGEYDGSGRQRGAGVLLGRKRKVDREMNDVDGGSDWGVDGDEAVEEDSMSGGSLRS